MKDVNNVVWILQWLSLLNKTKRGLISVTKEPKNPLNSSSHNCGLHNSKLSWGIFKWCIDFVFLLYIFERRKLDGSLSLATVALRDAKCFLEREDAGHACLLPKAGRVGESARLPSIGDAAWATLSPWSIKIRVGKVMEGDKLTFKATFRYC